MERMQSDNQNYIENNLEMEPLMEALTIEIYKCNSQNVVSKV
jgi:hypothetical protein